jgi:hypothetical protein
MLRLHVLLLAASHRSTLMTPCNLNMPQPIALALLKLATHSVFMSSPFFGPLLILLITRGGSLQGSLPLGPLTCSLSDLLYREAEQAVQFMDMSLQAPKSISHIKNVSIFDSQPVKPCRPQIGAPAKVTLQTWQPCFHHMFTICMSTFKCDLEWI